MEEMQELFYKDAYLREFRAEVVKCSEGKNGWEVVLADTAFYPEGGGQPADHGVLGGANVTDVRTRDGEIVHYIDAPLECGTEVTGVIDWERRFDHMQNHSGEHIVSGLIHKAFGYDNVGFHLGPQEILIDFDGMMNAEQVAMIEQQANDLIMANVDTIVTFPSEEERKSIPYRSKKELSGVVRLVEFPDADLCACCGTHVRKTGEIGLVKVTSFEKHKNGTRLHLLCGKRALKDYDMQAKQNAEISHILSAKIYETAGAVERLKEENGSLLHRLNMVQKELLAIKASAFAKGEKLLIVCEQGLDGNTLREYANQIKALTEDETIAVLSDNGDGNAAYIILSNTIDLRAKSKELNATLNGRGGGKPDMIQGSFHASIEEVRTVLQNELA